MGSGCYFPSLGKTVQGMAGRVHGLWQNSLVLRAGILKDKRLRQYRGKKEEENHMKNLKEVLTEANGLCGKIDSILQSSTYDKYDDMSGLDIDYRDGEQLFLQDELRSVMKGLDEVKSRLEYLVRPIREVSRLHRNESGRFETDGGHCYTSGSSIEALVEDGFREVPYWVWTSLEHDGKDYYLVGYSRVKLDGLTVRVRREV